MYMLLIGKSPFAGATLEEVIEKNSQCYIEFPAEVWKDISKEGLDLVSKMLERDQYQRLNVKECLEHEWFKVKELKTSLKKILAEIKEHGEYVTY